MEPVVTAVFEPVTCTWQYIVSDPSTRSAAIIDSVLDYDSTTAAISTRSADALLSIIAEKNLNVTLILETHAHADHLTAASYLQNKLSEPQAVDGAGSVKPPICIGERIKQVQSTFAAKYGMSKQEYAGVFDKLWNDDEEFAIGGLSARAVHLPGHTPDHMGYHVGNNVFVGDSIFQPDVGSARADFPGGSAPAIYDSCRNKLLSLPGETKIWVGHDYPPSSNSPEDSGRAPRPWATVDEHRQHNKHLRDGVSREEFTQMRSTRDSKLSAPRLIDQALRVSICGGRLHGFEKDGDKVVSLPQGMVA
ncbi:beta-lactamase-like protein [Microdochium trichocladiopsis]|uniref:Beta-lactamase-like protein n=1 Tax=Microdochium trichocladiopsis TaxID=1682393 RepID=A0A9P9BL80_9PEZI|nr:beta-lactamase-like protein [Microdochium trichocladiopsis]KAH7012519.1 beta-lactamase-like protein [Microdochium trichocladiopsis]